MSWTKQLGQELNDAGAAWLRMERDENRRRWAELQQREDEKRSKEQTETKKGTE